MAQAPGSLTIWAPSRARGSQTAKAAPAGSARTAKRPAGSAASGPASTRPPARPAASAAASASATRTWVTQAGGTSPPPSGAPTPATSARDEVVAGAVEVPAEQRAVEGRRGVRVGTDGLHPAGDAVLVGRALAHLISS